MAERRRLFVGAIVHSRTRSNDLVETLIGLGFRVSYDCVLACAGYFNGQTLVVGVCKLTICLLLSSNFSCCRCSSFCRATKVAIVVFVEFFAVTLVGHRSSENSNQSFYICVKILNSKQHCRCVKHI